MTAIQRDVHRTAATQDADPGAGSRLREARMAAGLSVQEVAARLHLYPKTITLIESDDYAQLPAPTFVRGYLRAYARLLELPPGPIVEAFDRHGLEPPALVADIANNSQARSGDFPVRIATYLIVLGLGALVAVWWQNQGTDPLIAQLTETPMTSQELESDTLAADVASGAGDVQEPAASDPAAGPGDEPTGVADDPQSLAMPVSDSVRDTASATPDAAEAAAENAPPGRPHAPRAAAATPPTEVNEGPLARADRSPPAATSAQTASSSPADIERDGDGTDVRPPADTAAGPGGASSADRGSALAESGAVGDDTLQLHFQHDSWVEVYGADDARLYYNLARRGQTVAVRGVAPFRVLLGYARGVRVVYNGVGFDHTPHIRGDIARFELGQDRNTRSSDGAESAVAQTPPFSQPGR